MCLGHFHKLLGVLSNIMPKILCFLDFIYFYLTCMPACLSVCRVHAWLPTRPKEDIGSSGSEVTDVCERPFRFWEPNLYPLQSPRCSYPLSYLSIPAIFRQGLAVWSRLASDSQASCLSITKGESSRCVTERRILSRAGNL